jgi:transcriptional regulator with XRE-family HTH domain
MAMILEIEKIEFGNNVKRYRGSKKLSLAGLAALAGIEKKQVNEIEHGRIDVTLSTITKLVLALEVTPNDLIPSQESAHKDGKREVAAFGANVKYYRTLRKLSQANLAQLAGIENKTPDIRLTTVIKLIRALEVRPNDLISNQ